MEYEIDEGDLLFDTSTNPSLMHAPATAHGKPCAKPGEGRRSWAKASRKAVSIPEEESLAV